MEASAFGGLSVQPPYHESESAPGNGRVTSAIYLNGEEKSAILWSFEIGIGGEGDQKLCELISRIREVFGIADQVQIVKYKKYLSVSMRDFKAATYSRPSKRRGGGLKGEQIAKAGNKSEKTAGTREHKPIFKGNKGTRTPLGDPPYFSITLRRKSLAIFALLAHFSFSLSTHFLPCTCFLYFFSFMPAKTFVFRVSKNICLSCHQKQFAFSRSRVIRVIHSEEKLTWSGLTVKLRNSTHKRGYKIKLLHSY